MGKAEPFPPPGKCSPWAKSQGVRVERLQADYGREVSKNSTLSERIYEVCAERDSLKGKVRDYERVRRAIGLEQADRILEAAYQQEQAEKERKRAARQKTRVGAR